MRQIHTILLFLILFSVAVCAQEGSDPGWKQITSSDIFIYQYSSKQVIKTPEGTMKFCIKMSPTVEGYIDDKARNEIIGLRQKYHESTKGYAQWKYRLTQYELNCSQRKFRILVTTDYKQSGRELDSKTSEKDWLDIAPNSIAEEMFGRICHLK